MIHILPILLMVVWLCLANGLIVPRGFVVVAMVYTVLVLAYRVLAYFTTEAAKAHARRVLTTTQPDDDREIG